MPTSYLDNLLLGPSELGADLTTTHLTELVTDIDTLLEALAEGEGTDETTGKHVSGTVGVDDLVIGELWDFKDLGVGLSRLNVGGGGGRVGRGDEGRLGSLGDNNESGLGSVRLGEVGEGDSDLLEGIILKVVSNRYC